MPAAQHEVLAAGRWHTLTLTEQLANVGSEVIRALRARDAGRTERCDRALTRALELFDLTAADARWRGPRRRETLRARELVCRVLFAGEEAPGATGFLASYFLQFAVAARRAGARPR
ncbi:MAG TPA: hypothetical protein VJL28_05895 [Gemmatimonadaceae bacterium]|nr:hypothetical protein [Gemmatimonadaceae bacterium]